MMKPEPASASRTSWKTRDSRFWKSPRGAEAIICIDQTPPDLVLLDHQLPDGTALDFLPRLRAREEGIPIFILTAFGSIDVAAQAVKLGAEQFLTTPPATAPGWQGRPTDRV